jgi:hypothetical protein
VTTCSTRCAAPFSAPRALTANDLKKGVASLATIGATAPFVGLLGTVVGVINAFHGHRGHRLGRHRRRLGRYRGGARQDRARAVRRHPGRVVLQLLDGPLEYFNVEMDNSSSELVDYFIKKTA